MKYLCLVYQDESAMQKMSKAEMDQMNLENWAFAEVFQDGGQLIVERGLQPTHTAITVRVRNGKMLTSNGPSAETQEQLSGFYLIEASDLNDAIQVASKIPSARRGSIEIRPIRVG